MAEFKLVISDPKTGRTMQKEVKDNAAKAFLNKKIGESVSGNEFELNGFEFMITGGSDKSGFPMRKGILFPRKKVLAEKGSTGFRGTNRKKVLRRITKKKTVCGERISDSISQINLKMTQGSSDIFPVKEAKKAEEKKE